jgi:tetratricopeptide (TPR) repeat protein
MKSQEKGGAVGGIDGAWALDHAQFILSHLSQPILTRMEYFSNNRKDQAALAPLAGAADELLRLAARALDAAMKQLEAAKPFDEKAYAREFAAAAETRYYTAWCEYFQAMALDPAAAERKRLLAQAIDGLAEWAVDEPDNGVNFQSYLLRGKARSEAGDPDKALADFAKAQSDKAPSWVQYQARYQTVVVHLRAADYAKAQASLDAFKLWIPKGNGEALTSADMLGYRVLWAVALTKSDPTERRRAQRSALESLAAIIGRDPRFRDLVYEQLAAQIPENADSSLRWRGG